MKLWSLSNESLIIIQKPNFDVLNENKRKTFFLVLDRFHEMIAKDCIRYMCYSIIVSNVSLSLSIGNLIVCIITDAKQSVVALWCENKDQMLNRQNFKQTIGNLRYNLVLTISYNSCTDLVQFTGFIILCFNFFAKQVWTNL